MKFFAASLIALFAWAFAVGASEGVDLLDSWHRGGPGSRHAWDAEMALQLVRVVGARSF